MLRNRTIIALALLTNFSYGCSIMMLKNKEELVEILISPETRVINISSEIQFSATGVYSDGNSQDISSLVSWSTGSTSIATINDSGMATATSKGSTSVTAHLNSITGTATLTVIDTAVSSWTKLAGADDGNTEGRDIILDNEGNIYITGFTSKNLNGVEITGKIDAFLIKYDNNGEILWTKLEGATGFTTTGSGINLDDEGNVYITGSTNGELNGQTPVGTKDVFVIKYNSTGVRLWTLQFGAVDTTSEGKSISIDTNKNIYITGFTNGNLNGKSINGVQDAFVAKYNSSRTLMWTNLTGAFAGTTGALDIVLDTNANSYIVGFTTRGIDEEPLTGIRDTFVIKYNTNGIKQWTKLSGTIDSDTYGASIAVDGNDNIYVSGDTDGPLDSQPLTGSYDVFVMKYNSSGNKLWTSLSGAVGALSLAWGIAVDDEGNSYSTGYTKGNLNTIPVSGISDTFIIKLDTNGAKIHTKLMGETGIETIGYGVALDSQNNACVTGLTKGSLDDQPAILGTPYSFVSTKLN